MKMLFVGALTALTVATASAQDAKSANDVLPYCKLSSEKTLNSDSHARYLSGWCRGAIKGLIAGARRTPNFKPFLCLDVPKKALAEGQPLKVVVTYADRHPGELTQPFVQVAARALHEAWPCSAAQ
jgi:Rap1a immunity proteins